MKPTTPTPENKMVDWQTTVILLYMIAIFLIILFSHLKTKEIL